MTTSLVVPETGLGFGITLSFLYLPVRISHSEYLRVTDLLTYSVDNPAVKLIVRVDPRPPPDNGGTCGATVIWDRSKDASTALPVLRCVDFVPVPKVPT